MPVKIFVKIVREEELRLQRRGKRLCIGLWTLRDCLGLFLSPSFPSIGFFSLLVFFSCAFTGFSLSFGFCWCVFPTE